MKPTRAKPSSRYRELLRNRDFLRYFVGEGVCSIGDAMSEVTIVLLAMSLVSDGNRPMGIAVAAAAYLVPSMLSGVVLASWIEDLSGHMLLQVDNVWRGTLLGLAGVLAIIDQLEFNLAVGLLALASISRPLGSAGSRALVVELTPRGKLFAANSLIGSLVQCATLVGPVTAGLIIAWLGPGLALVLDAVSFLFFAGILLLIPKPSRARAGDAAEGTDGIDGAARRQGVGLTRVLRIPKIGTLFALTAMFYLLYGPFVVALPLMAEERSGSIDPATMLGALWSCFGVGAVLGGLLAGRLGSLAKVATAALSAAGWGLAMVVMALPLHFTVTALAMLLGGLVYAPYGAIVSTVMQNELPERGLNAASSYYASMTSVVVPAGTFIGGLSAGWMGPSHSVLAAGVLLVAVGLLVSLTVRMVGRGFAEKQPMEQSI